MIEEEYSIRRSRQRVQHVQRHWGMEELSNGGGAARTLPERSSETDKANGEILVVHYAILCLTFFTVIKKQHLIEVVM